MPYDYIDGEIVWVDDNGNQTTPPGGDTAPITVDANGNDQNYSHEGDNHKTPTTTEDPSWWEGLFTVGGKFDLATAIKTFGSAAAALSAWDAAKNPPKTGYQGGIPELTAVRRQLEDPPDTSRPGAGGHRYFTDTAYGNKDNLGQVQATIDNQAVGLTAANDANAARKANAAATTTELTVTQQMNALYQANRHDPTAFALLQTQHGWSDADMAKAVGMNAAQWTAWKTGVPINNGNGNGNTPTPTPLPRPSPIPTGDNVMSSSGIHTPTQAFLGLGGSGDAAFLGGGVERAPIAGADPRTGRAAGANFRAGTLTDPNLVGQGYGTYGHDIWSSTENRWIEPSEVTKYIGTNPTQQDILKTSEALGLTREDINTAIHGQGYTGQAAGQHFAIIDDNLFSGGLGYSSDSRGNIVRGGGHQTYEDPNTGGSYYIRGKPGAVFGFEGNGIQPAGSNGGTSNWSEKQGFIGTGVGQGVTPSSDTIRQYYDAHKNDPNAQAEFQQQVSQYHLTPEQLAAAGFGGTTGSYGTLPQATTTNPPVGSGGSGGDAGQGQPSSSAINDFYAQNSGDRDAIRRGMEQYGVTAEQAAAATGKDVSEFTYANGGLLALARGGTTSHNPRYLSGDTDGMADKIPAQIDGHQPAALAHGEFVIPADVVSHLGNGNSDAGAKQLYKMMDKIRMARTGRKAQGKEINPDKFTVGGLAYAAGGAVQHFDEGGASMGGPSSLDTYNPGGASMGSPMGSPMGGGMATGGHRLDADDSGGLGMATGGSQYVEPPVNNFSNPSGKPGGGYSPVNADYIDTRGVVNPNADGRMDTQNQTRPYQMNMPGQDTNSWSPNQINTMGGASAATSAATSAAQNANQGNIMGAGGGGGAGAGAGVGGGGGGASTTTPANVVGTESSLSNWVGPYVTNMLAHGQALANSPYSAYKGQLSAGDSALQNTAYSNASHLQVPGSVGDSQAGLRGIAEAMGNSKYNGGANFGSAYTAPVNTGYTANQAGSQGYTGANVGSQGYNAQNASAATGSYDPSKLVNYQMGAADRVGSQNFTTPGTAEAYMSPYMQNVVNTQQQSAQRASDIEASSRHAKQATQGAFGGSRGAMMDAEAARNLATQKDSIQAQGQQSAFQQSQGQFNADQSRNMTAQQANQGANLSVGQQNLNANMQTQQLGQGFASQFDLASLGNQQQSAMANAGYGNQANQFGASAANAAAMANQASANQASQFGAGASNAAALANAGYSNQASQFGASQGLQSAGLAAQYGLAANNAATANNQFGANYGLQALNAQMGATNAYGQMGLQLNNANLANTGMQSQLGDKQQATTQAGITADQNAFNQARDNEFKMVQFQQSLLQGLPLAAQSYNTNTNPYLAALQAGSGASSTIR